MKAKAAIALLVCLFTARRAEAHATLISSTPSHGSLVSSTPSQVRLLFSEPIVGEMSHLTLVGADSRTTSLAATGDPREVRALVASMPSLPPGGYRLDWHIISADGHPVSGSIAFSVGSQPAAMPASPPATDNNTLTGNEPLAAGAALYPALLRGLSLSALLALCGLLGFAAYTPSRTRRQENLCGWLSALATLLLICHLVSWLIHVSPSNSLDNDLAASALSRKVGLDELVRVILAALSAWSILLARHFKLGFAFALAAVLAGGTIGHPAAIEPLVSVPSKALHLVGVAFWFGGLLWLATLESSAADVLSSAGIVSNVALVSIIVVAVTGAVQSLLFLSQWSEMYTSAYGLTLIAKIIGLIALASFGAWHRWRLMPRAITSGDVGPFRRSVRMEILVMIAVVMLGGFLAYVPVPRMTESRVGSNSSEDT